MNPSAFTFGPWTKVVVALSISALCIVGYLQISQMASVFFQPSLSGAKGLLYYLIGDDLDASRAYRDHFLDTLPNSPAMRSLKRHGMLPGAWEDIRTNAEFTLTSDPQDPDVILYVSTLALEDGNPARAAHALTRLLQTYPDHATGLLYSAIAHARMGQFEKAISQLNRALNNSQIASNILSFILVLETAGSFNDLPNSDKPWCFLAQLYRYLRIFDSSNGIRAIQYAQQAVEADDFPAHAYFTMAVVYTKQGKLVQALEAARKSTELDNNFADGYWKAGYIYGRLGDIANEYVMYKTAFELAPWEPLFVENLGFVMMEELGDAQQTIQLFERAVQVNTRNWQAYQWLGWAYAFLDDHEQAVSRYQMARQLSLEKQAMYGGEEDNLEHIVDIHEELALSQWELGRLDEAIGTLRQALDLAPYDVGPRVRLANLYIGKNRYKEAVQEIDIALQSRWLGINSHSGLCAALYEAWESKRAANCFQQVLKRDPYDRRARRLLPEVLRSVSREETNLTPPGQSRP